jgi:hypothetical protein
MAIPDNAPPGSYTLQFKCPDGSSSAAVTVTISGPPIQFDYVPIVQPSGSDQQIGGAWFGNTEGNGYISFVSTQNSRNTFEVTSTTNPGITSWSENTIQYTLPIVEPGPYQMTLYRDNNDSSQPQNVQITPPALQGWVDLHTHPLANLAFGGKLFYGNVDSDPSGTGQNGSNGGPCAPTPPLVNSIQLALGPENWVQGGYNATSNPCGDIIGWPATSVRDQVIQETEKDNPPGKAWPDSTYTSSGYPGFPTWPTWYDITHQKMWVDWIKRSFDGGQRVMVALAVNSKTLGDMTAGGGGVPPQPNDWPTDDAASAELQIQQIKNFVGRSDFMEVALSSADVYRIVKQDNKMAVIIGVEINNIGDLGNATSANRIIQGGGGGSGGGILDCTLGLRHEVKGFDAVR